MGNSVRWSEDQLAAHQRRAAEQPKVIAAAVIDKVANQIPHPGGPRFKSKWEARFAERLDLLKTEGSIVWWGYEALTLLLPGDVRYRVDFTALKAEGGMSCFEVKGRMMEPARIKLRQAIDLHRRFEWYLVTGDMTPRRLYTPGDVPATTRSRK